jgi:ligand-binding sensor domain-containing protein
MSMLSPKCHFWRWLLLCLAGLAGALAAGGRAAEVSPWFVRAWQTDDGLPDNDVTGIVQAEDGYLWVATQGGLARFDGVRFQAVDIATPSQRTRPLIRALLAGQGQTLWLAMEGGDTPRS